MYAVRRNSPRTAQKGFTLVEILIVVIILGILAAIVIPQFTSASDDARKNSLTSQVQTIRSQVELYKLQHTSGPSYSELFATAADQWKELTNKTATDGTVAAAGAYGPYLQTVPVNNVTGVSGVLVTSAAIDETGAAVVAGAGAAHGYVYSTATGKFFGLKANKVYLGS